MEHPLFQEDVVAQLATLDKPWTLHGQCHPRAFCDLVLDGDRLVADCADCAERIAVFAVVRSTPAPSPADLPSQAGPELGPRAPAAQEAEVWVDARVQVLARYIQIQTSGPGGGHRPPVVLRVAQRQPPPAGSPCP